MKWFTSDLHLSHRSIIQYADRPFDTIDEMNHALITNISSCVKKYDTLYVLGDLSFTEDGAYALIGSLSSIMYNPIHWIFGNHDSKSAKKLSGANLNIKVSGIEETKVQGNNVTMCHYPMVTWNKSHYNSWMLYGHHHKNGHGTDDLCLHTTGKMLNVNCEFHDFKPWSEDEIMGYMCMQPDNWDYKGDD